MRHTARLVLLSLAVLLLALGAMPLASCYVETGPGYLATGVAVPRPAGPAEHYVWVPAGPESPNGYWRYVGPNRPGWVWVPAHRRADGVWVPGHWRRG